MVLFLLAAFFFLLPDEAGLATSEVGSMVTGVDYVGLYTIEVAK